MRLVSTIKLQDMQIRRLPGTKIATSSGEVIYTPPESERVIRDKLSNLEHYIHTDTGVHPLIKLGVIHYQFEAIHPFTDGNGRTGRIINVLYLVQQGLLQIPVLYLSRYLIQNKMDYYKGLRAVTESEAWEPWILFILDAVEETANETRNRILQIRDLMTNTGNEIREKLPNLYSKDLVEMLFYNAYVKVKFLEDAGFAKRQTAASYLRSLEEIGVLASKKIGRENYFINRRLLDLLAG